MKKGSDKMQLTIVLLKLSPSDSCPSVSSVESAWRPSLWACRMNYPLLISSSFKPEVPVTCHVAGIKKREQDPNEDSRPIECRRRPRHAIQ